MSQHLVPGAFPSGGRVASRLFPDEPTGQRLAQLASLTRRILGVRQAHFSLLTDVQTVVAADGDYAANPGEQFDLHESLCSGVARTGRPVIIGDTRDDASRLDLPAVKAGVARSFSAVPLRTEGDQLVGAVCVYDQSPRIWTDNDVLNLEAVAAAVAAELELGALAREYRMSRDRWNLAADAAGVGAFDMDLATGHLYLDARLQRLFGFGPDDRFDETMEGLNARIHPTDLPAVRQARQRASDRLEDYEVEYRVVLGDGEVRHVQARGRAVGDETGRPARLLGAAWDISRLRVGQSVASNILEGMPVAHVGIDADWHIASVNHAGEQLLDARRWELVGREVWDVLSEIGGTTFETELRQAVRDRRPHVFEAFYPAPVNRWIEARAVPDVEGLAVFMTDVSDRHAAQQLAAEAAEHDRAVAHALQSAMLSQLPEPDHLEIRARYITAAQRSRVGGDWYDAIVQPDGVTSITVGDASGHDITAAGFMGQLRSMLRAFTWENADLPSDNLRKLDLAIRDLRMSTLATCITGQLGQSAEQRDRGRHTFRWSNAGNMPPVLLEPDGEVRVLRIPPDPVLGIVPERERHDHTTEIPDGSTLLLFTDGLVETRRDDIDDRLARLAAATSARSGQTLDELLDGLLGDMVGSRPDDDVVVLGVRLRGGPPRGAGD